MKYIKNFTKLKENNINHLHNMLNENEDVRTPGVPGPGYPPEEIYNLILNTYNDKNFLPMKQELESATRRNQDSMNKTNANKVPPTRVGFKGSSWTHQPKTDNLANMWTTKMVQTWKQMVTNNGSAGYKQFVDNISKIAVNVFKDIYYNYGNPKNKLNIT